MQGPEHSVSSQHVPSSLLGRLAGTSRAKLHPPLLALWDLPLTSHRSAPATGKGEQEGPEGWGFFGARLTVTHELSHWTPAANPYPAEGQTASLSELPALWKGTTSPLSPSKPTGSHTKAWSGQNKLANIKHAANLPHFSWSSHPRFHSPGHRNALQAASTKCLPLPNNKPEKPGGAWTGRGALTEATPCTEICKTNYCISKPSQTKYKFPQKHPNKALSIIKTTKTSIFLT